MGNRGFPPGEMDLQGSFQTGVNNGLIGLSALKPLTLKGQSGSSASQKAYSCDDPVKRSRSSDPTAYRLRPFFAFLPKAAAGSLPVAVSRSHVLQPVGWHP